MGELMPVKVDNLVFELLSKGFMYVAGRDRHLRPILVNRPGVLNSLPQMPTPEETIKCLLFMIEYIS